MTQIAVQAWRQQVQTDGDFGQNSAVKCGTRPHNSTSGNAEVGLRKIPLIISNACNITIIIIIIIIIPRRRLEDNIKTDLRYAGILWTGFI
jgi:hypothetical protein